MLCLNEGNSHKMSFSVYCHPPLEASDEHSVFKDDVSVSNSRVYVDGDSIHFHRVKLSDAGVYTLSSTNPAGQGRGSFSLRVKCELICNAFCIISIQSVIFSIAPPRYLLDQDYLKVVAGSSPHVDFTITSHPPLEEARHTLKKKGEEAISKRFKVEGGRITFQDVNVRDSGLYTISCYDKEGEEGKETLELKVLPASESDQLPPPPLSQQPQLTGVYH